MRLRPLSSATPPTHGADSLEEEGPVVFVLRAALALPAPSCPICPPSPQQASLGLRPWLGPLRRRPRERGADTLQGRARGRTS